MTDLTFDDPCVLFALAREAKRFLREFRPQQSFPGAPCWAKFCGPSWLSVLVMQTGMGAAAVERALDWLLARPKLEGVVYRPRCVLVAGFAGGLSEAYQVGDIVLATEVVASDGRSWPATWPGVLPPGQWQPPIHRGRVLTAPRILSQPTDKRDAGTKHEAIAVDMEAAPVANACQRHGIPFGCVRAISDEVTTALSPQLVELLAAGPPTPWRLTWALTRSPRLLLELRRLARHTRHAASQLAQALGELLTLTLPFGASLG